MRLRLENFVTSEIFTATPFSLVEVSLLSRGGCCCYLQGDGVEVTSITETLVNFLSTRRNNPEDSYLLRKFYILTYGP
jgi:hypothetical protein